MTVFRVQVNYRLGVTGKWSNVWHVDASTISTALGGFLVGAVPALLDVLHPDCVLHSLLVSDPSTDAFITSDVDEFGTSSDSGDRLPLFNAVKALIPTPGFGRPDYKFMKGWVTETLQENGALIDTARAGMDSVLTGMISTLLDEGVRLCSKEGDFYTNFTIQPELANRQMHRKRRKKVVAP